MSKKLILVVEDDSIIRKFICTALTTQDYEVIESSTGKEAVQNAIAKSPDVMLLDLGLEDIDGIDVIKTVRQISDLPIIVVSAREQDREKVEAFDTGADDYITKPFSLAVLRARVNTQLRKNAINLKNENGKNKKILKIDCFVFDFDNMIFLANEENIELSKTEQKLLKILVEHQGVTVSRNMLIDYIWTDGAKYVDENALSVSIKRLRDKLGAQDYIKTVYGIGYSWVKKDE